MKFLITISDDVVGDECEARGEILKAVASGTRFGTAAISVTSVVEQERCALKGFKVALPIALVLWGLIAFVAIWAICGGGR